MGTSNFLDSVISRLHEYKSLGEKTFGQLEEADLHFQPGEESNSIAILIRHLHGNMLSRWTNFLTEDGEKEWRQRDEEFEMQEMNGEQLLAKWQEGWSVFLDALGALKNEDLTRTVFIRGQPLTVTDAILRQLAHYSYHVGQIVYIGRMVRGKNWKSLSLPKKKR